MDNVSLFNEYAMIESLRLSTGEVLGKYFMLFQDDSLDVILQRLKTSERVSPEHSHSHLVEGVFLIKGSLSVKRGEDVFSISEKSYVHFPSGLTHMVWNDSEDEAEFLLIRMKNTSDKVSYT